MPVETEKITPTEDDIAKLIADSNPAFPLMRVNALAALTLPEGTVFERVAGRDMASRGYFVNRQGADIIFRYKDGTPFFREVQKFECHYSQSSTSGFRGSVWHKALFPLFWISIEELYGFYDVWFYLGSWSFFDEYVPAYIEPIPKEYAKANFQNLYRYLEGFVQKHLLYCRNCFINPDEVAVNFKLAEKLKPVLLELFHGQIKDIEIIR